MAENVFDPSKHKKGGGGTGGGTSEAPPAGEYVVALVWFERRSANSGSDYIRAKFQVLLGQHAGKAFFTNISFDLTKQGAVTRLSLWCNAIGHEGPFDLSQNRDVKRVFGFKPFKIRLRIEEKQGATSVLTNYEIERYIFKITPGERVGIDEWIMEQAEQRAMGGGGGSEDDDDAPPPDDDDAPPRGGYPDDDIPF